MITVVGLGNPGAKYANNRHNVGQMFLDYLLSEPKRYALHVARYTADKRLGSQLAKLVIDNREILLAKPQTYMNRSGAAIKSCVTRYTSHVTRDLIVVHDDLDIPLGKFKIQKGVGPKLHNGLESIEQAIKTKDFWRVRIGVDNRQIGEARRSIVPGETYVLQDFLPEEKDLLFSFVFNRIWTDLELRLKKNLL